jgi:hypothetical protein
MFPWPFNWIADSETSLVPIVCHKCLRDFGKCNCCDADQRSRQFVRKGGISTRWCVNCDSYYSRCKCSAPKLVIVRFPVAK